LFTCEPFYFVQYIIIKTNQINKINEWKNKKTEKSEKITKKTKSSLVKALSPQQEIDKALLEVKMFSIHEGTWRYFNRMKWEWFILPNDGGRDIYVQSFGSDYKDGEPVKYIEVNDEAIPIKQGIIKTITKDKDVSLANIVITSNNSDKKNVIAKSIDIDFFDFKEWDEVEFVANKKGIVVAIAQKE